MGKDYYKILQITRSAKDSEIKQAYRKLALNFHPLKNPSDKTIVDKFKDFCEAYDVLSNPKRKAIYDQYGDEGLKNGIPLANDEWSESYTFHGNADKVFYDFFGGDNPFNEFNVSAENDKNANFGGIEGRGRKKQDAPIEKHLMLSLEECYHGCIKKMRFERKVMNEDGHTSNNREKILTINVKKGWTPGTRIVFEKEGDQGPNNIPADIIFIVQDKPHSIFRRVGIDLVHTHKITLGLALVGTTIHIPTLDGRLLDVPITDIVRPGYTRVIPGEGMPHVDDHKQKGNLTIEFDIEFPKSLNLEQKEYVRLGLLAKSLPKKQKQQKPIKQDENEDEDD